MSTVACLWDDRFRIGNAAEEWPRFRGGFGISRLHTRYRLSGRVAMAMQAGSTFPPRSDRTKSLQLPRRRLLLPIPGLPPGASALHLLGVFGPLSGEREPSVSFAYPDQLPPAPKSRLTRLILLRAAIHEGSNRLHCQTASSGLAGAAATRLFLPAALAQEDTSLPSRLVRSGGQPETAESERLGPSYLLKQSPVRGASDERDGGPGIGPNENCLRPRGFSRCRSVEPIQKTRRCAW
jgi:hypothetical protein